MAFTWTILPVDTNTDVKISQLNEVYTNVNIARAENGLSGSVTSGKSSTSDKITAEDINKIRREIDIIDDNYTTGCATHYTAYLRTNNAAVDFTVNSSVNSTDCITVNVTHLVANYSTKNLTICNSHDSTVKTSN